LAKSCRFLWRDYEPEYMHWEVVDLLRKLFLTSMIIFVDVDSGSSKILRLVVAAIVSGGYLATLALARPFHRADDLFLACTANLLLTCSFVSGIVIHICDTVDGNACSEYLGLNLD
jgi:hypothetical protein